MFMQGAAARRTLWACLLISGCAARPTPQPQVPVKQHYASERATDGARAAHELKFALQPEPGAERLLKVNLWDETSSAAWLATFFSDGTLQVEARIYDGPTLMPSAKLNPEELERLRADMPALEVCRRAASACIGDEESQAESRKIEILSGPLRGHFVEHNKGARAPTEFLQYEAFVVDLIRQAVESK